MNTQAVALNLSRKWRSQNFDQIVGQDLVIRILKNSLYVGHYFPVYLFAGQRGCGKTSTARIFAAALNCEMLVRFQQDPKISVPCLSCSSCIAMQQGKHPDFIEIDAASYTGVDHMRNIIESSSLLPIMGRKRVYLIDEAHMLSKAAFNAALKVLEEPSETALFILATTNPHKIIDTVRSRCFQLFFTAVAHDFLKNHLQAICVKEGIAYDDKGLDVIVRHTQGSVRDALNMLEQARFSHAVVNEETVLQLCGHLNDQHILKMIHATLSGFDIELLQFFSSIVTESYAADYVWQRLMTLLRGLIWIKHGVRSHVLVSSDTSLKDYAQQFSLSDLYRMLDALYHNEELFLKTSQQYALLEFVLLQVCQKGKKKINGEGGPAPCMASEVSLERSDEGASSDDEADEDSPAEQDIEGIVHRDDSAKWYQFITKIESLNDPLILSLFKQAKFINYDQGSKKVVVECAKDLILFKDWLEKSQRSWLAILKNIFAINVELSIQFTGLNTIDKSNNKKEKIPAAVPVRVAPMREQKVMPATSSQQTVYKKKVMPILQQRNEKALDISDKNKWKIASMLLQHFPGVVTEIRENR